VYLAPCPAYFNRDGGIDGSDVEAFFRGWESRVATAAVKEDGGVDNGDVERFLVARERGGC
jgi:O-acetyl-ADP-ribose deacetylase (regulator of RNase III)